jgi:hypothetical protein
MDGHGEVGQGMEQYSKAGKARRGKVCSGWVWCGEAGMVRLGMEWQGTAGIFNF